MTFDGAPSLRTSGWRAREGNQSAVVRLTSDLRSLPDLPEEWTAECVQHLRIGSPAVAARTTPEIGLLLKAAYSAVQNIVGQQMVTDTFHQYIFPNGNTPLPILRRPVTFNASLQLQARDNSDRAQPDAWVTLDDVGHGDWEIDNAERLHLAAKWLYNYELSLSFDAGLFNNASSIPDDVKQAIYMTVGSLYANRGDTMTPTVVPPAAVALLEPHRDARILPEI